MPGPELGPDVIELVQGGLHRLANRPNPLQPEAGSYEIRLDPQPFQRIRLRPVEPARDRSGVGVERRNLGGFTRRALRQEPNDAVSQWLVFPDQALDCALAEPGMLV